MVKRKPVSIDAENDAYSSGNNQSSAHGAHRKGSEKIEYVPPRDEDIEALAYGVCEQLAESRPNYMKREVHHGFARFLKVLVHIRVQQLNREADQNQSLA